MIEEKITRYVHRRKLKLIKSQIKFGSAIRTKEKIIIFTH